MQYLSMMKFSARAPCRIDLSGGWTDVPPFSTEHEGRIVSMAIDLCSSATIVPRDDKRVSLISEDYDTFIEASDVRELEYDGNLDLIKAAIKRLSIPRGLDCRTKSDAPPGSGLGTSASMGVAILGAMNRLLPPSRRYLTIDKIAMIANLLEVEELRIPGGKQDQYAAAFGGINFMTFSDPRVEVRRLACVDGFKQSLREHLILCYTGKSRLSGNIITKVMDSYRKGIPEITEALFDMAEISGEMARAICREDLGEVASLMTRNWEDQKVLDPSVNNDTMEAIISQARKAGAVGFKACGAGGGGCLAIMSGDSKMESIRKAILRNGSRILDYDIAESGLQQQ
jgi:D-glycero-alpha-D-manno-heptose-7-phosphate kinase